VPVMHRTRPVTEVHGIQKKQNELLFNLFEGQWKTDDDLTRKVFCLHRVIYWLFLCVSMNHYETDDKLQQNFIFQKLELS
jgi:hypothetical protein